MTPEEDMKEELLVRLCCGDRCMEGVDRDGGCERWTFKDQAESMLFQAGRATAEKLANLAKRHPLSD